MENNFFKSLFDSFLSRTVITLLGIAGTIITIYAFLQEQKVDLTYEIIANTNVLDFNADLSKLEVTYDSTNLKQTKQNLRIFTIKIVNHGDKDILKEYYDFNEPLGMQIKGGRIIETPELINASSDYLKRNLKTKIVANEKINFSQVILESNEYFIIKILVLHKKDIIPKIISAGKIAGQKDIIVMNAIDVKKDNNFLEQTFYGTAWTQVVRLIAYFFGLVFIIAFIIIISTSIDGFRRRQKKAKIISNFKDLKSYEYTRMDDAIFDRYKKDGPGAIKQMQKLINSEKELNEMYTKLSEGLRSKEFRRFRNSKGISYRYRSSDWSVIKEMTSDGVIFKDQNSLKVNLAMKDTIEKFVVFLEQNGEFKENNNGSYTETTAYFEMGDEDPTE
ncbi:MAG: hypothetical protein EOO91_02200 [Pedobacter sp.]|nr:MAG: hypothetical protein EOO91_02200 [Pedobacter sp.]